MSKDLLDCLLSSAAEDIDLNFEDALNGLTAGGVPKTGDKFSVVHSGDTDSSDDDDNRNFENQKLNECGKSIKSILSISSGTSKTSKEFTKTWLNKPLVNSKSSTTSAQPSETVFGVRVINPLVSSNVIEERIRNREVVAFNRIKFFIRNIPADKDWIVAGAIVQKTVKTSQNDKKYCMWTLSDLKSDLKSVVVFLFGSAYRELWKTSVGMVVGILNPNILDGKDDSREEARFGVSNHQQIMILGTSKDYGVCKSMKKNGEHCTSFVNKSVCEFCLYHVKQEYQQFSKRAEIQSGFVGGPHNLTALRNKVLGKDQVFYAGKLYTAVKNPKQVAKDNRRLQSLNGLQQNKKKPATKRAKQTNAAGLEITASQRTRDLQRLKMLGVDTPINSERSIFNAEMSREVTTDDAKTLALRLKTQQQVSSGPRVLEPSTNMVNLDIDFKSLAKSKLINSVNTPKLSKQAMSAKQKAIKWVQTNGSIKKCDPNNTCGSDNPKKRPLETFVEDIPNSKASKIQENEFFSERFKKMMAATSSHMDLVENHDQQEQEKYFNKLEMKERLEEKMLNTYKMPCKAVRCLKCKYTSFSASDLCKAERHPLKVFDTMKRFFKCGNCTNRIVCLEVVPTTACKNCGNGKWERTGMMKERKIDIGAPKLSIRGGEQKFVNSDITDSNLDLMVPDQ